MKRLLATATLVLSLAANAAAQSNPGVRIGGRDFRQGDGEWVRQQRVLEGESLRNRVQLGREERLREDRQDRADEARWSRGSGYVAIPDETFGQKLDTGEARRLDRATQAERRNQERARKAREELLARQRAEREAQAAGERGR